MLIKEPCGVYILRISRGPASAAELNRPFFGWLVGWLVVVVVTNRKRGERNKKIVIALLLKLFECMCEPAL